MCENEGTDGATIEKTELEQCALVRKNCSHLWSGGIGSATVARGDRGEMTIARAFAEVD